VTLLSLACFKTSCFEVSCLICFACLLVSFGVCVLLFGLFPLQGPWSELTALLKPHKMDEKKTLDLLQSLELRTKETVSQQVLQESSDR
jgi:hypothetical protein